jgi:hypothetical protein
MTVATWFILCFRLNGLMAVESDELTAILRPEKVKGLCLENEVRDKGKRLTLHYSVARVVVVLFLRNTLNHGLVAVPSIVQRLSVQTKDRPAFPPAHALCDEQPRKEDPSREARARLFCSSITFWFSSYIHTSVVQKRDRVL